MAWEWAAVGGLLQRILDSEVADEATDSAKRKAIDFVKTRWSEFQWEKAEEAYRQKLLPFISTTRLLGNPQPVSIDQLYTDLFVYGRISALRRSTILADPRQDGQARADSDFERESASSVVGTKENLYLLGHPGAGKTTFLRYIGIRACRGLSDQVPIYLQLRDIVRSYDLQRQNKHRPLIWEAILNEFDICQFPDIEKFANALFQSGRAIILIDGLDEVPSKDDLRAKVIESVCDLQRRYPRIQICITCRIAASEYAFEHFRYAEVAPFTQDQQSSFIYKWYINEKIKQQRLLSAWNLPRSAPLRDLGRTPLLLALICLAFDDLGELPDRHVDLYREALDALFKRWDTTRSIYRDPFYAGLTAQRREQLLQEIAYSLQENDKITFSAPEVDGVIAKWFERLPDNPQRAASPDTQELLDQVEAQHGLIIQRARGIYSFAHLTIQEFLCAKSICEGHPERTLKLLAERRLDDPRWREVIVFCSGLLQDGTQFLDLLVKSSTRSLLRTANVHAFVSNIGSMYQVGSKASVEDDVISSAKVRSAASPMRLTAELIERLDGLPWAGKEFGLRARAALAFEHLLKLEARESNVFEELSTDGSALSKYLQIILVIVDCAAVATCAYRDRLIAPLLAYVRS